MKNTTDIYYTHYVESLLKSAAEIALKYHQNPTFSNKKDGSLLTRADLEVQAYINEFLYRDFTCDGLIAEEDNLVREAFMGDTTWVLDPIDGTFSFIHGLPSWGISLGLIKKGKPYAGFFYMPVTREFFAVEGDGPVLRNGKMVNMKRSERLNKKSLILTQSKMHLRTYGIRDSYPGKVQGYGSTITHLSYLASGKADAVLLDNGKLWDLLVGMAMLQRNGGVIRSLESLEELDMKYLLANKESGIPLLAAREDRIEEVRTVIRVGEREKKEPFYVC